MGRRLIRHEVVDSTNERALAAVADGTARDGDVHVARGQSAGRGRRGRRWESATGEGLYLSLVQLPPPPGPPAGALTMAAGLAVLDALEGLDLPGLALEWPNDVFVGGAKLCGILVESRGLDPARPHYVVGIGLNVLQRRFPPALEAERPVTSLAGQGLSLTVAEVLERLAPALAARMRETRDALEPLTAAYLDATGLAGRAVVCRTADRTLAGRLVALDFERGVVLADGDELHAVALGHVVSLVARPPGSL